MHEVHVLPSFGLGGAQTRLCHLINAMPDRRFTIISLSDELAAATKLARPAQVEIKRIEASSSPTFSVFNIARLRRALCDLKPALVCTYNWGAIEAVIANRLGPRAPHAHFEDGFGPDEADGPLRRRGLARRALLAGNSQLIVASTTLETIAVKTWGFPDTGVHLLPGGVDTARFAPTDAPPAARPFRIGMVGGLRPEKNIHRGLRVIARLREEVVLDIVGAGPEDAALRESASKLGVSAKFFGSVSDPASLYRSWHALLLTSDTEQRPFAVLEAMASGLPVVATDVGDIGLMVAPENQPFIRPVTDEGGLAEALDNLRRQSELAAHIGAANRDRAVALFSLERMIEGYRQLANRVVEN